MIASGFIEAVIMYDDVLIVLS